MRAEPPLLQRVLLLVPGQEQASAFAYHEVFRSYVNSICPEQLDFLPQALEVERHAGAEHVHDPRAEDAGGQQVQGELPVFVYDGVARVPAALIADDDVEVLGEQVHHPALALVAPVYADYRAV